MTLTTVTKKEKKGTIPSMLRRDQFISIWGFMIFDFKLEKTELLVYAIIFSIYRHLNDCFDGSRRYLQTWTNSGKTTVDNALNSLVNKKLIIKEYKQFGSSKKAIYFINTDMLPTCEMFEIENKSRDIGAKIRKNSPSEQFGIF